MKKAILITSLFICLFSFLANAQQKSSIDLTNYKISDKAITYSDYSENTKQTIISILDDTKLNLIVLDEALNKTKDSIFFELPSTGYHIEKTSITSKNINYLLAKKDGYMSLLSYDRAKKEWNLGNSLLKDGERLLSSCLYKNKFHLFNYERKTGLIKVYTAEINGLTPFKTYNLNNFKLGENDLSYFLKKKKKAFKEINSESPIDLFAARKSKKVYQFKETIYFSIDDSISHNTGIIQFDLNTKKHSISYFKNIASSCDSIQFSKSTLTENYLATIAGCLKKATINFWDLKTKKIIKTTSIIEKELITYKNFDNLISPKKAHSIEILKSQVLLRKLAAKEAAIYMVEHENNLELIVGRLSIKKKKNKMNVNKSGGGKGNGSGGGRQKKLNRIEKGKVKGYGLSKSFLNYQKSRPQYFACNFNLKTKKFDTETLYQNSFEDASSFKIKNNLTLLNTQILFKINSDYWFGYIKPQSMNLELTKIN
ncbi:MAG: hypothetical protein ACPGSO_04855 [Vicingaceae bacterium]